jgi:hypothetical protein
MYQLTQLGHDLHRERLARAEAQRPADHPNHHQEDTMNRTRPFRRLTGIVAALATALLAVTAAAAQAAFALPVPPRPTRASRPRGRAPPSRPACPVPEPAPCTRPGHLSRSCKL